jgi:CheY-like chemotaxis protein
LAGGIAHDLNNILTVISGNIGLAQIEAPVDSGSLLGFLSKAGQAAQHAAHLSSQLLTFSKGGAPLKKVVSMGELLEHSAEFSLYGSNLRADVEIPVDLSRVEVDAAQIEQVVNALMINAREAMPRGGTVKLSARNVEFTDKMSQILPEGRYVKILIADRGTGVPDEIAPRIFDPYFTTKPSSPGLGLSISYSIVKRHGGMLHLESSSSEGAKFAFYLPATESKLSVPAVRVQPANAKFNHQRILVMDDEAAIRDLTSQLLGTLGYEVTAVPDGLEAVKLYDRALRRGRAPEWQKAPLRRPQIRAFGDFPSQFVQPLLAVGTAFLRQGRGDALGLAGDFGFVGVERQVPDIGIFLKAGEDQTPSGQGGTALARGRAKRQCSGEPERAPASAPKRSLNRL